MALMKYREPNQVRWQGVRPGHNGTQIAIRSSAANNISVVYTVTAGKVFYWTHYIFTLAASAASYTGYFYYRDAADLNPVYLAAFIVAIDESQIISGNFNPPLEILAGYDICVRSDDVAGTASFFIHGWEE